MLSGRVKSVTAARVSVLKLMELLCLVAKNGRCALAKAANFGFICIACEIGFSTSVEIGGKWCGFCV